VATEWPDQAVLISPFGSFACMADAPIPDRLAWAVQALHVAPTEQILEIGCGNGAAVSLVCDRLTGGCITAIDRSATGIDRAIRRNTAHVMLGRAVFRCTDLAGFDHRGQPFDTVFAINVNLFWVGAADVEWHVVSRVLHRAGVLHLFYETPTETRARTVAETVTAALTNHGFSPSATVSASSRLVHITGRPGHHPP
jgi:cyclopropane fatty-acyl-phospholipid synthase-like methyltransferase